MSMVAESGQPPSFQHSESVVGLKSILSRR